MVQGMLPAPMTQSSTGSLLSFWAGCTMRAQWRTSLLSTAGGVPQQLETTWLGVTGRAVVSYPDLPPEGFGTRLVGLLWNIIPWKFQRICYVVHSQLPNYNILTFDPCRYTPGRLIPNKWESCFTIQHSSWGYDRTEGIEDFWNTSRLLWQLVSSVSCNGNLLLNVGPTADGRIVPAFQERLLEMGAWLEVCVYACMSVELHILYC